MSKLRGGIKNVKKLSIVRNKDRFLKSHIGGILQSVYLLMWWLDRLVLNSFRLLRHRSTRRKGSLIELRFWQQHWPKEYI